MCTHASIAIDMRWYKLFFSLCAFSQDHSLPFALLIWRPVNRSHGSSTPKMNISIWKQWKRWKKAPTKRGYWIMERNLQNPNSTRSSMRSIRQAILFTWTYMFMVEVMVTPVAAAFATLGTWQFCLNQLSYSFRTYIPQNFRWTKQFNWSWQTAYYNAKYGQLECLVWTWRSEKLNQGAFPKHVLRRMNLWRHWLLSENIVLFSKSSHFQSGMKLWNRKWYSLCSAFMQIQLDMYI